MLEKHIDKAVRSKEKLHHGEYEGIYFLERLLSSTTGSYSEIKELHY